MTYRTLVMVLVALPSAVMGCGDANRSARTRCGNRAGDVAGLPAPAPVWTYASANTIYFAPRAVDLDGDGVPEVVVTGGNEVPDFGEVVALDGASGAIRWRAAADKQLYSSPVLLDITGDGVKDVFVSGRLQAFIAVDGATGDVLWRFEDTRAMPEFYFYNFYTPVLVDDQTGDGLPDLLVANGGGDGIPPGEARPPGYLLVLSSADGSLVAQALLPDKQETYMSPIVLPDDAGGEPTILFGTGGESWSGSLWATPLAAVVAGDLSAATKLVAGVGKGMIAPPALADIDGDGRLDILVATFDGRLVALDGATKTVLWQRSFDNAESYTTPAVGRFDGDDVPDVFAVFLHGVFPDYTSAERVLVSGRDGRVLWRGEAGDFAMAGDVAVDLDGDGIDEVIFNANTLRDAVTGRPAAQQLYLIDGARSQARPWGAPLGGFAAGSPWVGDLDADGCLDLVVPRHGSEAGNDDGLLTRFRVAAPVPEAIHWAGYFGTEGDSIGSSTPPP